MDSKSLIVILTENSWLYVGLTTLIQGFICVHSRFSDSHLPDIITEAERVLIVVDSRIIFRGEWSTLNALKIIRPDASIVWLMLEETGRLLPEGNQGDRMLDQRLDIAALHIALKKILSGLSEREHVGNNELTHTEHSLLTYFVSDLSMHTISYLTGKNVKTLYTHRQKIMTKTGFRSPAFFKFVYKRNQGGRVFCTKLRVMK
ncbi:helix-turn-helix transcriptional regulator [Lelliottia nimipressuralis]